VQLSGQFERTLDDKGRVVLPSRLRELLAGQSILITDVGDRLSIWPTDEFGRFVDDLTEDLLAKVDAGEIDDAELNETLEFLWAGAQPIKADQQGRMVIPEELLTEELRGADVVLVGARDHINVFPASEYFARKQAVRPKVAGNVSMYRPRRRTDG
jgi:MraZ protein